MKFIHIADIHLGAQPDAGTAYSGGRPRELWDAFSRVVTLCEEEKTDILLIAGDLFHRQPLLRELKEVNYLFSTLSHTKVVFIAGNHDYIRKGSYYRTFQWSDNVYPLLGDKMGYVRMPELDLAVYGFSYHAREIREERCNVRAQGLADHEILLAHGGDEKHVPLRREILEALGFDYIALGHIHKPQAMIKDFALFAGALEPVDKNDTGQHGFVRGEITEQGVHVEFIPCASREYIHLALRVNEHMTNGSVKDYIRETVEKRGTQNIYKFILRGQRDPDVEFEIEYMDDYGNIIEIEDETCPAFDYQALYEENQDNLLGKYIEEFLGCEEGSMEYQALQAGVQALLENGLS